MEIPFNRKIKVPLDATTLTRAGIPAPLWAASGSKIPESVRGKIKTFVSNIHEAIDSGTCLMLIGESGVGKSGIAAVISKIAKSFTYTALFTSVWELRE